MELHGHGTGAVKGEIKTPWEFLKPVKVVKQGGSYYVALPPAWVRGNNFPETLLMVISEDIRIVNPVHDDHIYDEVTKIVRGVQ